MYVRIQKQTHEWNKVFFFTLFFLAHSVCSIVAAAAATTATVLSVYRIPLLISSPLVFKWLFFSTADYWNVAERKKMIENKSSTPSPLPPPHRHIPAHPEQFLYFIFRLFLFVRLRTYYNICIPHVIYTHTIRISISYGILYIRILRCVRVRLSHAHARVHDGFNIGVISGGWWLGCRHARLSHRVKWRASRLLHRRQTRTHKTR